MAGPRRRFPPRVAAYSNPSARLGRASLTRPARHRGRAQVGFLYLRYVGEPRTLWSWFEEYLADTEARFRKLRLRFLLLACRR